MPQTIKVFRESSKWNGLDKWFMMRMCDLQELYVCTYDVPCDEDDDPIDMPAAVKYVTEQHPDSVLVY